MSAKRRSAGIVSCDKPQAAKRRRAPSVGIVEFDEHHHITPYLAVQGERGCLCLYDSHDDMGVGPMDIGTWLLPAAARGCFGTILWASAWCKNLPNCNFEVALLVGDSASSESPLTVVYSSPPPPPAWRALWGDACVPRSSISSAQCARLRPLRIIKTDASGVARQLVSWQAAAAVPAESIATARPRRAVAFAGCAAAAATAIMHPTSFQLTVDLDFFSVRNPALRSIPFSDLPGFRRDLIALAQRVPMERGAAFVGALEALVAGDDGPHEALPAVAAAAGIAPASTAGDSLLRFLALVEATFQLLTDLRHMESTLQGLLLVNLAEHEATHAELDMLETGLARAAVAVRWCAPIAIARSELYTPRRQLPDILARTRRALAAAKAG